MESMDHELDEDEFSYSKHGLISIAISVYQRAGGSVNISRIQRLTKHDHNFTQILHLLK